MGIEIERRFFVKNGFDPGLMTQSKDTIHQTYLLGTGDWAMRGRMSISQSGSEDFSITLKQSISKIASKEINIRTDKNSYLDFCSECLPPLRKTRYYIPHDELTFEVDIFHNPEHIGLIIAELEIPNVNTKIKLPPWIDEEITERKGYSNFSLFRKTHGIKKR